MRMGRRKPLMIGVLVVMAIGIAVYLRLWTADYAVSSNDTELLRRQFDLANREAMDESAEWRLKYDQEFEKASKCSKELIEVKDSLEKQVGDSHMINQKLAMLQKENIALEEKVKILDQQLKVQKLKCSS